MYETPLLSPLRYPGSKRRLARYIQKAILVNHLQPMLYVEPFIGGGSVALQLIQYDLVKQVILMDIDPLIAGFWRTAFFDSEWLNEQICTVNITLEQWNTFKAAQPTTDREWALTCLFLNRTNFSGILEAKAGPMGGRAQNSPYKIDCRFPRETLIARLEQIASLKHKVAGIWCCSWEDGMKKLLAEQIAGKLPKKNIFFYFDPPFFNKAEALYRYYFVEQDHYLLRDFLLELNDPWILSYDSAEQVETLYGEAVRLSHNGTRKQMVELLYSIAKKRGKEPVKEVIISNLKHLPDDVQLWQSIDGKKPARRAKGNPILME